MSATSTHESIEAFLAKCQAEGAAAWSNLIAQSRAKGQARFEHVQTGAGIGVIVTSVSYAKGATEAEVLAGTAEVVGITATEDARQYVSAWHLESVDGAVHEDAVYVERYEHGHQVFHGFIDRVSRKIVQAG